MTWFLEKPLFLVAIGLVTSIILCGGWLQTGRKSALHALALTVVLTSGLVMLERAVQTDREQVELTLERISRSIERNDLQELLGQVHSEAITIRSRVEAEFRKYTFDRVSIKQNLEIEVAEGQDPRQAVAKFNVVVVLGDQSGMLKNRHVPRYAIVTFQREGDAWRVLEYEHHDPRVGYQRERTK